MMKARLNALKCCSHLLAGLMLCGLSQLSLAGAPTAAEIAQWQAQQAHIVTQYAPEMARITHDAQQRMQAPDVQAAVQALTARGYAPSQSAKNTADAAPGDLFVFISSSLPTASLMQWLQEADALGATLVLRGFVNDSLPETEAWLNELLKQTHGRGGVQINPPLFQRYGITQVPTVVVTQPPSECAPAQTCATPAFDKLSGNLHLRTALQQLSTHGTAAPDVAHSFLIPARKSA